MTSMSSNDTDLRSGRTAADLDTAVTAGSAGTSPTPETESPDTAASSAALIDEIEEALRDVVDPELGVNVVDLGLLYDLQVGADNVATIDMTLTSAACPLTDMIEEQIAAALLQPDRPLVDDFRINWVWLPPWGPDRITEDGREQLRALGFNI
jgi:metal-sulfur cluster biosynthetic enzyme